MQVKAPPPTRACEVCYAPVPVAHRPPPAAARCDKHVDYVRPDERDGLRLIPAPGVQPAPDAPRLRKCPRCGGQTFVRRGACSTCQGVRPTPNAHVPNRGPGKRLKEKRPPIRAKPSTAPNARRAIWNAPYGAMDGRIVPELAREVARSPLVPGETLLRRPGGQVRGLLLDPDEPRYERGDALHAIGNRTRRGQAVTAQRPAEEKALQLMRVPGEWEVLAFYQSPRRVKAAVWYLRRVVEPRLPAGQWEFARCWWEHAAVMGRYTPP